MPVFQRERLTRAEITVVRAVATLAGGRRSAPVLVGGAVRDAWLGRRPGREVDLDVAVPAGALDLARRVAERLRGACVPPDPERGTGRVVLPGVRLDVSDFRGPSLAADLAARDFTVNALAVPLRELLVRGGAPIVDPTGGLADLRARRLRAPDLRVFTDDPLRALRGVRLEAALGFRLTRGTVAAIRAVAPALAAVAAERVRDELLLVLAFPDTARAFRRMDALGLLGVLLPEVEPMRATAQPAPHRFPVLEHSLRALASADRVLARLATLVPFGEAPRARYRFYRDLREDTQDLLLLALADAAAVTGASPLGVWRRAPLLRDLLGGWQEQQAVEAAAPLLRGEDVMGRLGLAPGPAVGRALARVREAQALGRVKTREQALAYLDSLSADP